MHNDISNFEVFPPCYNVIRRDRETRGGGVAILVKIPLKYEVVPGIIDHESVWCRLFLDDVILLIGGIYRPPTANITFLEKIDDYLLRVVNSRTKLVLIGDFNLPHVDWINKNVGTVDRENGEYMLEIMHKHGMTQIVSEPTRIRGRHSVLDLCFLSDNFLKADVTVSEGISDHKLVAVSIWVENMHLGKSPVKRIFDFTRADDTAILDCLELALDRMPREGHVETMWTYFRDTVEHCLTHFVSKRVKKNRPNPWVTREVIHLKRRLKRKRLKRVKNTVEMDNIAREFKKKLKDSRFHYFSETLTTLMKENPERFWRHLSPQKSKINEILCKGVVISDPQKMAEEFNIFFNSVFTKESLTVPIHPDVTLPPVNTIITAEGVRTLLLQVDTKKSSGPDNIPNEFLKRYSFPLSEMLARIFQASLNCSQLPSDWLVARVVPIHKTGSPLDISNYRPISLTCTACKIMEHIICKQLKQYLEDNTLLYEKQHGFRRQLSTVTQLFETTQQFASVLNERGQADLVVIDFSKAFDKVTHTKLVQKLFDAKVDESLISWIKAYLSNRLQYVDIEGSSSALLPVTSGVPQGSVLGPTLFLVYINDLAKDIDKSIEVRLFADDCLIYTPVYSVNDQILLNVSLAKIQEWCQKWDMQINTKKCLSVTITKKKSPLPFSYSLDGINSLQHSDHFKYLGVTISENLDRNKHINNICNSAYRKLGFLKRRLRGASSEVKLHAYKTMIRSALEYASIVWDPYLKKHIQKLERIQRQAVRFIFSKYSRHESVSNLLTSAGLESLETRRRIARLKYLYQLYNSNFNFDCGPYIRPPGRRSPRTAHPFTINPVRANIDVFKYSFLVRTIDEWNQLSAEVFDGVENADKFECKLKALL